MRSHFTLALLICCAGCDTSNLIPLTQKDPGETPGYTTVDAQFCTLPRTPKQQKIKYLFVFDHSTFNEVGTYQTQGSTGAFPGDDAAGQNPAGTLRYQSVNAFVQNLSFDASISTTFGLIDFNDTATRVISFESQSNFLTDLTNDWHSVLQTDGGLRNTPAALTSVASLISSDLSTEANLEVSPPFSVSYYVLLITDGRPTNATLASLLAAYQSGQSGVNNISEANPYLPYTGSSSDNAVQAILALRSNPTYQSFLSGISINTAYYYNFQQNNYDPNDAIFLQAMAVAGNGQYFDFVQGGGVLSLVFTPPIVNLNYGLSDVFIENDNVTWTNQGTLSLDSDGDGIPDYSEATYGSNPFLADSDKNGVSDLVELRTKGVPCLGTNCNIANRDPFYFCQGYFQGTLPDGTVLVNSSSEDGLNDCEKHVLGVNPIYFNNANDFIPDYVSFRNDLPFLQSTSLSNSDPFGEGLTNYQKIKLGLPTQIAKANAQPILTRNITLEHTASNTDGSECYHIVTSNVVTVGSINRIRVYVIQNNKILNNYPILKVAERTLNQPSSLVSFTQEDFQ